MADLVIKKKKKQAEDVSLNSRLCIWRTSRSHLRETAELSKSSSGTKSKNKM